MTDKQADVYSTLFWIRKSIDAELNNQNFMSGVRRDQLLRVKSDVSEMMECVWNYEKNIGGPHDAKAD